jgi:hypothetical protein
MNTYYHKIEHNRNYSYHGTPIIRLSPSSPTQTVTSPGYPNGYANNLDCVWQVLVPQGFRVWSNITNIDMESHGSCNYDYVQFYDSKYS